MLQLPPTTANVEEEVRVLRSIHGGDTEGVIQGLMSNLGMTREEAIMAIRSKNDGGIVYANSGWVTDSLLDSLRMVESSGRHYNDQGGLLTSPAGALGAYQWMPDSAANAGYGVTPFDINDEAAQRAATRQYLEGIQKENPSWSPQEVLMAYNYGPGNVTEMKSGAIGKHQIPQEALNYAGKVMGGISGDPWGVNRRKVATQSPPPMPFGVIDDMPSEYKEDEYIIGDSRTYSPLQGAAPPSNFQDDIMARIEGGDEKLLNKWDILQNTAFPPTYNINTGEPTQDYLDAINAVVDPSVEYDDTGMPIVKPEEKEEQGEPLLSEDFWKVGKYDESYIRSLRNRLEKAKVDLKHGRINPHEYEQMKKEYEAILGASIPISELENKNKIKKTIEKNKKKEIINTKKIDNLQKRIENTDDKDVKAALTAQLNKLLDDDTYVDEYEYDPATETGEVPPVDGSEIPDQGSEEANTQADNLIKMHSGKYQYAQDLDNKINETQARKAVDNAPKDWTDRITGAFKNAFSALFNEDELARMAIMYAGSRLFGYDHGSSIMWATKGYLNRISGIEQNKQAAIKDRRSKATNENMRDDYTLASLDKWIETGVMSDLIPNKVSDTGATVMGLGKGKFFDNKTQVMLNTHEFSDKVDRIWIDGQWHNLGSDFVRRRTTPHQESLHDTGKTYSQFKERTTNLSKEGLLGVEYKDNQKYIDPSRWANDLARKSRLLFNDEAKLLQLGGNERFTLMDMVNQAQSDYAQDFKLWQNGKLKAEPQFEPYYLRTKFMINSRRSISSDMIKNTDAKKLSSLNNRLLTAVQSRAKADNERAIDVYNDTLVTLGNVWDRYLKQNKNNVWKDNADKGWDDFSWWAYNASKNDPKALKVFDIVNEEQDIF